MEHASVCASGELAEAHLHVIDRSADEEQNEKVWDEEGASAIFVGDEWETPYVAQTDGHRDARHEEFEAVAPVASVRLIFCCRILMDDGY